MGELMPDTTHLEEYDQGDVQLSRSCPPDSNLRLRPDMREGTPCTFQLIQADHLYTTPSQLGTSVQVGPAPYSTNRSVYRPRPRPDYRTTHGRLSPPSTYPALAPVQPRQNIHKVRTHSTPTNPSSDILITPLDQFFDKPGRDPGWARKRSAKLAWRGSPTGISMMSRALPWRDSHRVRLHRFANDKSQRLVEYMTPDVGQEAVSFEDDEDADDVQVDRERYWEDVQSDADRPPSVGKEKTPFAAAANFFMDVKLAGEPLQCDKEDGTCEEMRYVSRLVVTDGRDEIEWAKHQPSSVLNRHKFLLDVDGNGWRCVSKWRRSWQWSVSPSDEYQLARHQSRDLYRMVPTAPHPVSPPCNSVVRTERQVVALRPGQARLYRPIRHSLLVSILILPLNIYGPYTDIAVLGGVRTIPTSGSTRRPRPSRITGSALSSACFGSRICKFTCCACFWSMRCVASSLLAIIVADGAAIDGGRGSRHGMCLPSLAPDVGADGVGL
jgi:hypothetical protein